VQDSFGRCHARLNGEVKSFQFHGIYKAGRVANDHGARRMEANQRVPSTFGNQSGAVGNGLSTGDVRLNQRMAFPLSKQFMRISRGILVIHPQRETQRHMGFIHMIDESTPIDIPFQGKSESVSNGSHGLWLRGNFDQFLEPESMRLEVRATQFGMPIQQFMQEETGRPFRQNRRLGVNGASFAVNSRHAVVLPNQSVGSLRGQNIDAQRRGDVC